MSFLLGLLGAGKIVGAFLSKLPWQLYAALGAVVALLLLWHVHAGWESKAYNTAYNTGWTVADTKWKGEAAKAKAAQIVVNARPAIVSAKIAKDSDHDSKTYYADGYSAGAAYARAHLVRGQSGTPGSAGGAPNLPATDQAAEKHDGPGNADDMVAVSRADFDILTGNSLRLAKVHQDAEQLIAAGIAEAD